MEREDMVTALHGLFIKGLEINLNTEEFTIIKLSTGEETECKHFSDWVNIFIDEGKIHPDDIENAKLALDLEKIKRNCAGSTAPRVQHYRRLDSNGDWQEVAAYYFRSCKWTNENPIVILGIMPIKWLID